MDRQSHPTPNPIFFQVGSPRLNFLGMESVCNREFCSTSHEERALQKCTSRCYEALSLYNCSDASIMFQAFARKVTGSAAHP